MSIIAEPKPQSRKASPKRTKSGAKSDALPRKVPNRRTKTAKTAKAAKAGGPRADTKQATLIDLLKRKTGATIDDLVKATGWQPHSVRGAISGTLKKKLGLTVTSEQIEKRGRVYRIVERG